MGTEQGRALVEERVGSPLPDPGRGSRPQAGRRSLSFSRGCLFGILDIKGASSAGT